MMHICYGVSKDCINHHTYGEICVICGCCSKNPNYRDRIVRTIKYYKECLEEQKHFNFWSDNEYWRKVQEKNVKSNISYYKKKIRKYKKILKTLKVGGIE